VKIKLQTVAYRWIYRSCRLIVGAIFIFAAVVKICSPQDFADSIASYQIVPSSAVNIMAMGLPLFELGCGLLMLTGFFVRIGGMGIMVMLAIFIGALIIALSRGLSINCGCFEAKTLLDSDPWVALVRDTILLGLTFFVYRYKLSEFDSSAALNQ
jgi:putative oxidoreductase